MRQIFFHIPFTHIPVYGYGVMLVIGLLVAMSVAQYLARRSNLDPEIFANAAILALVTGIMGARLSHVLENLRVYTNPENSFTTNFINAINIRQGGLTYYGGFIMATVCLILYALYKKVPLRVGMDIIAPCLMIGLGFGRIGCFLNGCCYGAECNVQWAVQFPYGSDAYVTQFDHNLLKMAVPRELIREHTLLADYLDEHDLKSVQEPLPADLFERLAVRNSLKPKEVVAADNDLKWAAAAQHANPVHPTEIYSCIVAFSIALFLLAWFTLPHVPGRIFAGMMVIEGIFRYVLEVIRVEPAVIGRGTDRLASLPPQSFSMVVSFFLVLIGIGLWIWFGQLSRAKHESRVAGGLPVGAAAAN